LPGANFTDLSIIHRLISLSTLILATGYRQLGRLAMYACGMLWRRFEHTSSNL
jgi:hypothetical protein